MHESERSEISLTHALNTIREAGLQTVTFPPNTLLYKHRDRLIALCQGRRFQPVLRVHPAIGVSAHADAITAWVFGGGELEAVFDSVWPSADMEFLRQLETVTGRHARILLVPTIQTPVSDLIDSLPLLVRRRAELYYPLKTADGDPFLSCDEIHDQLAYLAQARPAFQIRPYRGYDAPDRGVPSWFEAEPNAEPLLSSSSLHPRPEISVIVPTLNRKENVINTLRHLQRQDLDPDLFEVVIVDDGSDDGTMARIRDHLFRSPMRFNFRYFFLPRPLARRRGDHLFRAGIARNFGARKSTGTSLVFLDSDVLVAPDFLSDVRAHHQEADILQYERVQVPFKKSSQRPRYQDLNAKRDGARIEGGYWERFYEANDWLSLPLHWKYTSTSCLAVRRDHFRQVGGFSRAFRSYGFEDMLLGWQLARLGLSWRIRRKPVFHLRSSDEASEYGNSRLRKQIVMSRSAKLFYCLTLDEAFYSAFFPLLGDWTRTRLAMHLLSRSFFGRLALRPLHIGAIIWREPETARAWVRGFLAQGKEMFESPMRTIYHFAKSHLWKLKVPWYMAKSFYGQRWRIERQLRRATGELWRIPWALGAPYRWARLHAWKLAQPWHKVRPHLWGFRNPSEYLLQHAPGVHRLVIWPFKKAYHFTSYQIRTRFLSERK